MAVATIAEIQQRFAQGKGFFIPAVTSTPGAATAAAAASGQLSVQILVNNIGTTLPGTRVSLPIPPSPGSPLMLTEAGISRNTAGALFLVYLYRMGSVNLAATGDQFTANSATFPILRTEFGESSKPVTLTPMIYIDDAGTATAPVFSLKTNAGGAGYVDQDGNSTAATRTMTMPSATANVQSGYIFRLNDGDSGVQSISQVDVDTASGSAATGVIFGIEFLADITHILVGTSVANLMVNGIALGDLKPGVATSGTATATLAILSIGTISSTAAFAALAGVLDS